MVDSFSLSDCLPINFQFKRIMLQKIPLTAHSLRKNTLHEKNIFTKITRFSDLPTRCNPHSYPSGPSQKSTVYNPISPVPHRRTQAAKQNVGSLGILMDIRVMSIMNFWSVPKCSRMIGRKKKTTQTSISHRSTCVARCAIARTSCAPTCTILARVRKDARDTHA